MTQKSTPIIFNSEMVNAILEGRKTQTRRVLKPQPPSNPLEQGGKKWGICDDKHYFCDIKCPYGLVGDKLWVRETWSQCGTYYHNKYCSKIQFKGGSSQIHIMRDGVNINDTNWRSPVTMPRWASRITLQITNIRVERLQDISEEDAIAEGSFLGQCDCFKKAAHKQISCSFHGLEFQELWQSIKGKDSWNQNPFVWVIEFKKKVENE